MQDDRFFIFFVVLFGQFGQNVLADHLIVIKLQNVLVLLDMNEDVSCSKLPQEIVVRNISDLKELIILFPAHQVLFVGIDNQFKGFYFYFIGLDKDGEAISQFLMLKAGPVGIDELQAVVPQQFAMKE